MAWQQYIDNLLENKGVEEVAIIGCNGVSKSVWAASDGWLKELTDAEARQLWGSHKELFCSGVTLAGKKCTVVRDDEEAHTLDLKMKVTDTDPDPLFITVGKLNTALLIAKGRKDVTGGQVNPCVFKMVEYLREKGF